MLYQTAAKAKLEVRCGTERPVRLHAPIATADASYLAQIVEAYEAVRVGGRKAKH